MNPAQLSAYFAAHKTAILGGAAAAVAGLALYRKHAAAAGTPTTGGVTLAGTTPAAAIVGAQGPDSSSYDLYNAMQPELEQLLQTGASSGGVTAPPPVASGLFAPSGSGKLVSYSNGLYEMESDGSLYHLAPSEWAKIVADNGGKKPAASALSGPAPGSSYSGQGNLSSFIKKANPTKAAGS